MCIPIVSIDAKMTGNRHPDSVASNIRDAFFEIAEKTAI